MRQRLKGLASFMGGVFLVVWGGRKWADSGFQLSSEDPRYSGHADFDYLWLVLLGLALVYASLFDMAAGGDLLPKWLRWSPKRVECASCGARVKWDGGWTDFPCPACRNTIFLANGYFMILFLGSAVLAGSAVHALGARSVIVVAAVIVGTIPVSILLVAIAARLVAPGTRPAPAGQHDRDGFRRILYSDSDDDKRS